MRVLWSGALLLTAVGCGGGAAGPTAPEPEPPPAIEPIPPSLVDLECSRHKEDVPYVRVICVVRNMDDTRTMELDRIVALDRGGLELGDLGYVRHHRIPPQGSHAVEGWVNLLVRTFRVHYRTVGS